MTRLWRAAVNWFEAGDLVPLLVLVSAVHYAAVLASKDFWAVAVAIGLLVDLGHYRVVRVAVRYQGDNGWQRLARWAIAIGMTAVSLNYHQRYYLDWWLSAPLPLLIAALAWLQQVEPRKVEKPATIRFEAPLQPALSEPKAAPVLLEAPLEAAFICSACGYEARSQNALNGHRLKHRVKVDA
jgi:hypothetical protein